MKVSPFRWIDGVDGQRVGSMSLGGMNDEDLVVSIR